MAYKIKTYRTDNYIEYEVTHKGRYGAKGEKRSPKKRITPEIIRKQNQWKREREIRRVIQLNFLPNDLWVTLKYPKGTRKTLSEVEKDIKKFQDRMRRDYKSRGEAFKWVKRIEIGEQGGIHAHFIINRIWGAELLIDKNWCGHSHYESIREDEGMEQLAGYLTKPLPESVEQLSLFPQDEIKRCAKYSTSRNLLRPEPEVKIYTRKTVRKLLEDPPITPGFMIDKNSIQKGINPVTGYSYLYYREERIKVVKREVHPPDKYIMQRRN